MNQEYVDRSIAPTPKGGAHVLKREKNKWVPLGTQGQFRMLHKSVLLVDTTYQRETSRDRAVGIAQNFDWAVFGVLQVNERPNGDLVIVDGAHRWTATSFRDDITTVPCLVFRADSVSEEAMRFYFNNTTRKDAGPYNRHRTLVVGGDEVAEHTERIIQQCGYRAVRSGSNDWGIKGIETIHGMVRRDPVLAERVVTLAADVYVGRHMSTRLLQALMYLAEQDPGVLTGRHRERLVGLGGEMVDLAIQKHRVRMDKGGARVYAQAVAALLNKGLRSGKVFEP